MVEEQFIKYGYLWFNTFKEKKYKNKKQEFYGGFLKIKNIDCKNYNEKVKADNYSKIIVENEL